MSPLKEVETKVFLQRQTQARHNLDHLPQPVEITPNSKSINFSFENNSQSLDNGTGEYPAQVSFCLPNLNSVFSQTILRHQPDTKTSHSLADAIMAADSERENPLVIFQVLGEYWHNIYLRHNSNQENRMPVSSINTDLNQNTLDPQSVNLLFQISAAEYGLISNCAFYLQKLPQPLIIGRFFTTFLNPETGQKMAWIPSYAYLNTWTDFCSSYHLPLLGDNIYYQEKSIFNFYPRASKSL